jgi:hypothetical protein
MKTPMQQHMEWLHKKYILHLQEEETGLALEVWYCLKNAEQMLEKEKEVIENAVKQGWDYNEEGLVQWMGEKYYNETFNTK